MIPLGNTSLSVSRLAFGTVFMGERGDGLAVEVGAGLLQWAYERGVNFWDTSEDYGTQAHIAGALEQVNRQQVVICSKLNLPVKPVGSVLEELRTDYVDILLVHDVSLAGWEAAQQALNSWQSEKAAGKVRAAGISTHSALVAELACECPEVEVLMLPLNKAGVCLPGQPVEGGMEKMKSAAQRASLKGKGVVAMKVLGYGSLAG